MSATRATLSLLLSLCLLSPGIAQPDPLLAMEAVQTPELLSLGLPRFEQAVRRYPRLQATITLLDAQRQPLGAVTVEYSLPTARSHAVLRKPAGVTSVGVKLVDGDRTLSEWTFPVAALAPRAAVPTAGQAATVVGGGDRAGLPAPPAVALPDYAKLPVLPLAKATRQVDLAQTYRPIVAELNYPIAAARNNSMLGRQTADPVDPAKRSLYISLRSQRFDPATGAYLSDAKYLVELPLDKEWLVPLLQAQGEQSAVVPTDRVRVHATNQKIKVGGADMTLTGDDLGGMMQGSRGAAQDDQGNLYFAMAERAPVKFNLRTAEYEACPVDIYAFTQQFLDPDAKAGYPADLVTAQRIDAVTHVFHHRGRIYVVFARNAIFGKYLTQAAVISLPTTDWDNAEKFREQMRFVGGSWPTAQPAFWDTAVKPGEMTRRLYHVYGQGDRLVMQSYHFNYLWAVDLKPDGSVARLTRIETLDGRPVTKFSLERQLSADGTLLGVQVMVTMADGKDQLAFLPIGGTALTTTVPKGDEVGLPLVGLLRGEEQYGVTALEKNYLARQLGIGTAGLDTEPVLLYYDALTPMQRERDKYAFILDTIRGTSLAPSYSAVAIPGEPGKVIGVSEYGYYQAIYDVNGDGPVKKEFLRDALGDETANLPLTIGLGPYDHVWRREGDQLWLYYVGYTGVGRMLYRDGGKTPARLSMDRFRGKLAFRQKDAPPGEFKWYHEVAAGLDGKLLTTGVSQISRGGTPYSSGLAWLDPIHGDGQDKLGALSRGHTTTQLATRVLHTPTGPEQEIFLNARYQPGYRDLLPEAERPKSTADKLLVYSDRRDQGVRDRFGVAVSAEGTPLSLLEQAFSRDQLHLLLLSQDAERVYLTSYDPTAAAYRDGVSLPRLLIGRNRPDDWLLKAPDGRLLLGLFDTPEKTSATFYEVDVSPAGSIALAPLVSLTNAASLQVTSSMAFVENQAGGYDLLLGGPTQANLLETKVRVVSNFLPPAK